MDTPVHNKFSSLTSGWRSEFIFNFGSLGPGIRPISMILYSLYHIFLGKFEIVKYRPLSVDIVELKPIYILLNARWYGVDRKG